MRSSTRDLLLAVLALARGLTEHAGAQPVNANAPEERCGRAQAALASCLSPAGSVGAIELAADPLASSTTAVHYHLDIEVDPTTGWLGGSNVMTVRSRVDGLSAFRFRLDQRLGPSEVSMDERLQPWRRIDEATVEVTLDPPVATDSTFELKVAYAGYPISSGLGGISFDSYLGRPSVWTLSEAWHGYTWWPSKDDNADKVTADLFFTVPDPLVVASNGVLAGVDDVGSGRHRFHWQTGYPIAPYLICFSAGVYDRFSATFQLGGDAMPVSFFVAPDHDTPSNRAAWLQSLDMLEVFGRRFGPYPFSAEKYGIYEFPFHGGMEHQTMTGQGGVGLAAFSPSLTSHELAHQWWGDAVTCATWHDIWLNEGFATYAEALWEEGKPGSGRQALLDAMAARRPKLVDGSVYVFDTSDEDRIFSGDFSYRKAAWVLHMLRHVLCDERFFAALAAYRSAYGYKVATTAQFQAIVEGVAGERLTWFFDPWVYGIGAPAFKYGWRATSAAGRTWVELYLSQVQPAGFPTFTMPLDVWTRAARQDSIHTVWSDARATHRIFAADGPVDALTLDPERWVLATSVEQQGFVEGPPKIVATRPKPGDRVPSSTAAVALTFQEDVIPTPADFSLAGARSGSVTFAVAYDAPSFTVTLTPALPLPIDAYTMTVSDRIVDAASSQRLDGEVHDPADPASLPSGDGQPGGVAVVRFEVVASPRRHIARPPSTDQ